MSKGTASRENLCFYWVKTLGYHIEYTPFYLNRDGLFRVEVNDKTLFLTEYKLELLFGKGCVKRKVDPVSDIVEDTQAINAFLPYLLDQEDTVIVLYNPVLCLGLINGMIAPLDVTKRVIFKE